MATPRLSEQLETLERDVAAEKPLGSLDQIGLCCWQASMALRKAITRVDWVVATATKLREKEHKYLATSIAQGRCCKKCCCSRNW